jgi:hypothetical protein
MLRMRKGLKLPSGQTTSALSAVESLEARQMLSAVGVDPRLDPQISFDVAPVAKAEPLVGNAAVAYAASGELPASLANTFTLHSLPGANQVIYLDFNGHTTTGTSWNSTYNNANAILSPA